jgi:hypothetical protein
VYRKVIRYHPIDSFAPVALIGTGANILLAHPSVPVKTARELIAAARAAPGKFTLGSAGTGSITHLAGELFASMAGVKWTHVPYKGGGPNMIALLGGEIQLTIASVPAAIPRRAGRPRPCAGRDFGETHTRDRRRADDRGGRAARLRGDQLVGRARPGRRAEAVVAKLNTQINAISGCRLRRRSGA